MAPELFDEICTPASDIYSFGMCLLEICTQRVPYSECKSIMELYRHLSRGILPLGIGRIADAEVRYFVRACLLPVGQRPTATQLLTHEWMTDSTSSKNSKPVELLSSENEICPQSEESDILPRAETLNIILDRNGPALSEIPALS
jgi:WNK lysine deficient protein kinase